LTGGAANDAFLLQSGGSVAGMLDGGGGANRLQGPDSDNSWQITGANAGMLGNLARFASIQNLIGGTANDRFAFQSGGTLAGTIDGGPGVNTLDYSAYTGDVTVNLPLHLASLVNQAAAANSIFNIQNVTGSIGNDMLVGDANANVLIGGARRNVIIDGSGSDAVTGGGGDNILIGGSTIWDSNMTALQAIMQEWTNPNLTFDARVNALRRGIVVNNVTYALNRNTVTADNSPDNLIGGHGQNWFFFDFDDTINNGAGPGANDRVNRV